MPGKKSGRGRGGRQQKPGRGRQGRGSCAGAGLNAGLPFRGTAPPVVSRADTEKVSAEKHLALAEVNPDLCAGCGRCVPVCPAGAISMENVARIDRERCTGCGRCVRECPVQAISLR